MSRVDDHVSGSRRFVCVTDVAAPYRLHLFEAIEHELARHSIESEFVFMAREVAERSWRPDPAALTFSSSFASGLHVVIRGVTFHLNPAAIVRLMRHPSDYLMIGASWNQPTAAALLLLARHSKVIVWSEANRDFMTRKSGPVMATRRAILSRADAFAVPGRIARETIAETCELPNRPFLPLPNVVDERLYRDSVAALRMRKLELRSKWQIAENELVFLWPARLEERFKGIVNFLQAIENVPSGRWRILVAGEGSDRLTIERWLERNPLSVRLLGERSNAEMLELLALSDVFMLPSLRDSNPLSVIEALWSGLPLFLSTHCGNWPEAIDAGRNGWLIDPDSQQSMRDAFIEALASSDEKLTAFSRRSREIAEARFDTSRATKEFVESMLAIDHKTWT